MEDIINKEGLSSHETERTGEPSVVRHNEQTGEASPAGITFDEEQERAIELCTNLSIGNRIVAVTGAAGTGKTTIIREAHTRLVANGYHVAVTAPTGKAARRIREATGIEAVTIHRLLEFPKPYEFDAETGKPLNPSIPRRHKDRPVEYDVVICDEYAMVNQELNRFLIDALRGGAALRCFGDDNQLAPIEERQYQTLTQSAFQKYLKDFPSVTLTHVYRQAEGSGILDNAGRIVRGVAPSPRPDFIVRFTERPTSAIEDFVHKNKDLYSTARAQIICQQNKGWIGTYELNQRVQAIVNPDPAVSFDPPRHKWQEGKQITIGLGDKVVCTENLYDLRDYYERYGAYNEDGSPVVSSFIPTPEDYMILNGEVGKVIDIRKDELGMIDRVTVDVGDRHVILPYIIHEWSPQRNSIFPVFPMKSLDLGYCLTTHKCQGSEYEEIVYVMNKSTRYMQNRRNFYTAVTRARKQVLLITDRVSLSHSVWKKE